MSRKLTKEQYLERLFNRHPNNRIKYNYDDSIYTNSRTKMEIYCNTHNEFFSLPPGNHLQGQGCRKCGYLTVSKKLLKTQEEFIEDCHIVHGYDVYGYKNVCYVDSDTEVDIFCKKHNKLFPQRPANHLNGAGCPICADEYNSENRKMTLEEFIEKANKKHGYGTYGYGKSIYVDSTTDIEIYCNTHDEFFSLPPSAHLYGQGCKKCGYERNAKHFTKSWGVFIIDVRMMWGNEFGYIKHTYKNSKTDMEIICAIHGSFWATPNNHLKGSGCPRCRESKGEKEIAKYLDKNKIRYKTGERFDNCRDKRVLPFDFYLKEFDICMEYQGEQHYRHVNFSGKMTTDEMEENLKGVQKRDKIKKDYCNNNNILLIEIPYWDFKNIESIILNVINTYDKEYKNVA
jgi:hypothetical protein